MSPFVRRGDIITNQEYMDTTLCDKVCQWLATGRRFSPGTPVSSTNKTDLHDININEILLKVALHTMYHTPLPNNNKHNIQLITVIYNYSVLWKTFLAV
jgi:hypothetical protein